MKLGGVIKLITERGFGFIGSDDRRDYFVHANAFIESGLASPPEPGIRVRFDVRTNERSGKPEACDIEIVKDAA